MHISIPTLVDGVGCRRQRQQIEQAGICQIKRQDLEKRQEYLHARSHVTNIAVCNYAFLFFSFFPRAVTLRPSNPTVLCNQLFLSANMFGVCIMFCVLR